MNFSKLITLALAAVLLAACATPYTLIGETGGYQDKQLKNGDWNVAFIGYYHTTPETLQTVWLYRCASLTLEQGHQAFEIISDMQLSILRFRGDRPVRLAQLIPDAIGQMMGNAVAGGRGPPPKLKGVIRLLDAPFTAVPGRVFDAAALKAVLEPLVKNLCQGNVCPHPHTYVGGPTRG